MKKLSLKNWNLSPETECLLFFAQRATEVLFDFTLDSYKYPALYSSSSVEEAIDILTKIEAKEISDKSLEPIIDELKWKLRHDLIVKKIVGDSLEDYLSLDLPNISDTKIKLELLYNKISPKKYIKTCFETVIETVIENKKKKQLNKIIPNLFASLIDIGYSQNYLHNQTIKFFFLRSDDDAKIEKADEIKKFFELFTLTFSEYSILFKGSGLFKEITTSGDKFKIEIKEVFTPITEIPLENYFVKSKRNNEVFLICKGIRALDPQSAKESAEIRINNLSKLFTYFHHKKQPTWSKQALVYNASIDSFLLKVSKETSPMQKCFDFYPIQAAEKLNQLLENFGFESDSFFKFDRAVELHGISLISQFSENQLLQNWIAFETLLVGYSKESKIDQVLFALVPALKLNYVGRIISTFLDDLLRWNKGITQQLLNEIQSGENMLQKTAALLSIKSNKPIRDKFYSNLSDFPLLKFRLSYLQELLSTTKNLYEYYSFHEQKLIWQIKRIYRTRNLIVHTGYVPDFTNVLIENSHTYLDIFLNQIIELVLSDGMISNISHGVKEIQIQQKRHEDYLKKMVESGLEIDDNNFVRILFGDSLFANKGSYAIQV